jgi:DNA modification methylase
VLGGLPDESVQCVVTSPPYWGLRDYGVDDQLGLEPTPELYVENMVQVFREVRRVLRKDGTCFVNIGDSYASSPPGNVEGVGATSGLHGANDASGKYRETLKAGHATKRSTVVGNLKPKDLVGMPWALAFALRADGWYLRSEIIWAKPNPMPESVTDRPTKSHEQVFLLTRSPRYFYDADAVREDYAPKTLTHRGGGKAAGKVGQQDANGKVASGNFGEWDKPRTAYPPPRPQDETLDGSESEAPRGPDGRRQTHVEAGDNSIQHRDGERWPNAGRNLRSVWEIPTQPFPEAHFATYPQALVERCVKAGTSERGCCPECGAPWERETQETDEYAEWKQRESGWAKRSGDLALGRGTAGSGTNSATVPRKSQTIGWKPTCQCYDREGFGGIGIGNDCRRADPCVVLDPFLGSGTTALVARRLGRRSIDIELSPEYAEMAARRLQQLSLLAEPV